MHTPDPQGDLSAAAARPLWLLAGGQGGLGRGGLVFTASPTPGGQSALGPQVQRDRLQAAALPLPSPVFRHFLISCAGWSPSLGLAFPPPPLIILPPPLAFRRGAYPGGYPLAGHQSRPGLTGSKLLLLLQWVGVIPPLGGGAEPARPPPRPGPGHAQPLPVPSWHLTGPSPQQ